jgi:hypothetical protein
MQVRTVRRGRRNHPTATGRRRYFGPAAPEFGMKTPSLRPKKMFLVRLCPQIVFFTLLLLSLTACVREHDLLPRIESSRGPFTVVMFTTTNSGDFSYIKRAREVWVDRYIGTGETAAVPDAFAGRPVTRIRPMAFFCETNLTCVTLSSNLQLIDDSAFSGCTRLTNVCIPEGVRSIGSGAFKGCVSLTRIVIPNSVTELGGTFFCGGVFENCSNLSVVQLPASLKQIGSRTFYGCPNINSNIIPKNVEIIEEFVFSL